MDSKAEADDKLVRSRKIFYISGFDPKGPAHYHALYCEEAKKQSALEGSTIEVSEPRRQGRSATWWQIRSVTDGHETHTDYEFLRWDDLMRERMKVKGWRFAWKVFLTYWLFIHTGALWKILKTSYPTFLAGLYPIIFVAIFALVAILAAAGTFFLLNHLILELGENPTVITTFNLLVCVVVMIFTFQLCLKLEHRFPFLWPLHVYNFAADHMRGRTENVSDRVSSFAERIVEYVCLSNDDEVLVVSHSNGTVLAVSAMAEGFRQDPALGKHGPEISFLTLGQSIPLCSYLPSAGKLRDDLYQLANNAQLNWVDITAPRDSACFALADPVRAPEERRPGEEELKPKLLSVPISDLFSEETFRTKLRFRWLRIHFQYLMAYEKRTIFDFFSITAGPLSLRSRFQALHSKSGFNKFRLFG